MKTALLFAAGLLLHISGFSQNVGIGTTNPLFKLDVRNGSINVDSVYRIGTFTVIAMPGNSNLFVGKDAGRINTGTGNTFGGFQAGYSNTTGNYNSFFGLVAGLSNTTGGSNSFFGRNAGSFNTTGNYNSFFGFDAGYTNNSGNYNSFFGLSAGYSNTIGSFNTAQGYNSLAVNNTGTFNTAIGYNANANAGALTNATAIGANARVDCNNCLVLGSVNGINGASATVNVGIGTNNPTRPLSFSVGTGKKISLYPGASGDAGFGVFGNELRIHSDNAGANITFGYDDYISGFTERIRIEGNGSVGIGTNNPVFKLDVRNGSINTDSVYRIGTINVLAVPGTNNLFVGKDAGRINTGADNTFNGNQAGYSNTTGYDNSFFGQSAGYANNTGQLNAFFGRFAGSANTLGERNAFFGNYAGYYNIAGMRNTAVGYFANVSSGYLINATAIGFGADVDASNKVRIGNTEVISIGGQVGWSNFSDGRFKYQIQEDVQGLAFIKKLRTVSYLVDLTALNNYYSAGKAEIDKGSSFQEHTNSQSPVLNRQSGFIAQEVEQAAKELGFSFSGIDKPTNEKALYGLRYGDFVVPLVKAVQEQQAMIEQQNTVIEQQNRKIETLEEQNKKIEMLMKEITLIKEKLR